MGCLCSKLCRDEESQANVAQSTRPERPNVVRRQPSASSSVHVASPARSVKTVINSSLQKVTETSERTRLVQPTIHNVRDNCITRGRSGYGTLQSNNKPINAIIKVRHTSPPVKVTRNANIFNIGNGPYFDPSSVVRFVPLSMANPEYRLILDKVTNKRKFKIDGIQRVENPYLRTAYELKKEQKRREYPDLEERLLFHGTKRSNIESICKFNFNWRLCTSHRVGKGVFFSPNAMYSSNYSDEEAHGKVMIVAKVLIGKTCHGHGKMVLPDRGCDTSVKGDDEIVIVKYEDNEFCPVFLITYHLDNATVDRGRSRSNSRQRIKTEVGVWSDEKSRETVVSELSNVVFQQPAISSPVGVEKNANVAHQPRHVNILRLRQPHQTRHTLPPIIVARNTNIFNIQNDPYFNSSSVVKFVQLTRDDFEYRLILELVTNKHCFKIDDIQRVENPYLKKAYELKREQKMKEYPDFKERLLFHGTKIANLESICKFNLNWRLCKSHKYGKGISFSPKAMYASHYSDEDANKKIMIVAKVLIGKTCHGHGKMLLPDRGCDTSVKGDDEIVIVKYEDNEFCPVFVITYHLDNATVDRGRSRSNSRQHIKTEVGVWSDEKSRETVVSELSNVVFQQPAIPSPVRVEENANAAHQPRHVNILRLRQLDQTRHILPPTKVATNTNIFNIRNDPYFDSSSVVKFVQLSRDDFEYRVILELVTNKRCFKIDDIQRVENPYLKKAYELKKEQKMKEYPDFKERLLFHGTKVANLESICKFNLNWRFCKSHKYGKGISFSPKAMYASHYSDEDTNKKIVIVAKVLIGKTCYGHDKMILPDHGCDTSKKGDDEIVIVKYEDNEFYPNFVITYHLVHTNVSRERVVRSRSNSRQRVK